METTYNLRATVRYDGTDFSGWQVQPNQRTVQGALEGALSLVARNPVRVQGAGRTDAGVHALGQVCSFAWPGEPDCARIQRSVCKMLGPEVRMDRLEPAPAAFNARFSAVAKRYGYALSLGPHPDPFSARYAWRVPWRIDIDRLRELAGRLVGTHDFAGFQCAGASPGVTTRTLHSIRVLSGGFAGPCDGGGLWRVEFHADGFLYKMVRNLTGTLAEVVRGRLPESALAERLSAPGPYRGFTAPAHGLALIEVQYDVPATPTQKKAL